MSDNRSFSNFNQHVIDEFRANDGIVSGRGSSLLLLTTTGAKSGRLHTTPLAYTRDGDHYIILASKGGAPTNPAWYHNLVANPVVTVEVEGEKFDAKANVVDENGEYERLYAQHAKRMPGFNDYRRRTSRRIPVIVLERIDEAAA